MPTPKRPISCTHCGVLFLRNNGGREKQCSLLCRFWSKVERTNTCWVWRGCLFSKTGYGQFAVTSKQPETAHRFAWQVTNGEVPSGLVVRHKCDNRICCNPDHLEVGTHQDNTNDKMSRGRYVCGSLGRTASVAERNARSDMLKSAWQVARGRGATRPERRDFAHA
jgi:hypothetical protein